jgi:hypothetical protein
MILMVAKIKVELIKYAKILGTGWRKKYYADEVAGKANT